MDFSDDSDDAECLKIHGFGETESSSSDSGKSEFDEIHEKLKPPPEIINFDERHVVVVRVTDKIEKPSQANGIENNREKENNGKFINHGRTEKCRIVESYRSQSYEDVYDNTSSGSGCLSSNLMQSSVESKRICKKAEQARSSTGSRYVPPSKWNRQVYSNRSQSCSDAKSELVRPSEQNQGESSESRKKNTLSGYKPISQANYYQCLTCEVASENSSSDSGSTIQRNSPVQSSQWQNLEKTSKNTASGSGYVPPSLRKSSVNLIQSQCGEDTRKNGSSELVRPSRKKSRVKSSQPQKENTLSHAGYLLSSQDYVNQSLTSEDSRKTTSSDSIFPIQRKKEVKSSQPQNLAKTSKNPASGSGYISPSLRKSSVDSSQPQCWESVSSKLPSRKKSRVKSTSQLQKENTHFGYVPSQVNLNQSQSCGSAWENTSSGSKGSRRKKRKSQHATNEAFDPNLYQGDWNEIIDIIDLRLMVLDLEEAYARSPTEFLENVAGSIGVGHEMYFALRQTEFEYHQAGIESSDWSVELLHDQMVESFQQARKSKKIERNHSFWNQILMGVLKESAMVFLWDSFHCILFELSKN